MALKNKIGPITAVVVAAAAVTWMVIGGNGITVSPTDTDTHSQNTTTPSAGFPQTNQSVDNPSNKSQVAYPVQATTLTAQVIEMHLPLSGSTMAEDTLQLMNSYPGRVTKRAVEQGQFVEQGETIVQIDTRTLALQLEQASLLVKQKQLELDGIKKLNLTNLSSKVNVAQAETDLASAKATERALQVDVENANVTAPFSGVLNSLEVQEGQVLAAGASIGHLVSVNPIKISVNVPQNKIQHIDLGTQGSILLESGYETEGFVSYISAVADTSSRTVRVEMEVANPDNRIAAGLTAKVDFLLDMQRAHPLSPALLTLDDAGNTAIKTIDIDNQVVIVPVEIIKSERAQVWVRGLPDNVNIITVGQGFVSAGDLVKAHYTR
ncbi:efflux RND transporter periplasmic adaptor subunit [Marinomonas sp. A79]|uniref:Efflux RND transporter periplasmic adaptor subunit n=1 Tax=Marinomonas vulgaris TaxID=2823372 RepID=A0ABS5HB04_9GAMM|nr:efflux RND transporter periplasmic adaptor subunit [Marinomonas vulgaris]MBR7888588.1 efflux RND transporter periplasmic adaptor subunit [Marinomonas vulgaris]